MKRTEPIRKEVRPVAPVPVKRAELKQAIATVLRGGVGIDLKMPLAVYPSDGAFTVSYLLFEESRVPNGLSVEQRSRLKKDLEIDEQFDRAEDAAEFFLTLRGAYEA